MNDYEYHIIYDGELVDWLSSKEDAEKYAHDWFNEYALNNLLVGAKSGSCVEDEVTIEVVCYPEDAKPFTKESYQLPVSCEIYDEYEEHNIYSHNILGL